MDQSAFRSMLSAPRASTSSSAAASTSLLGAGNRKRARDDETTSTTKKSFEQLKPRTGKAKTNTKNDDKHKEDTAEKERDPFKRYGHTDRAALRRAEDKLGQEQQEEEERRPRGLDLSLLDASKRAILLGDKQDEFIEPEPLLPQKTEEEIERELEEAEQALKTAAPQEEPVAKQDKDTPAAPSGKKPKRSRADMLRDLQAKLAASKSGDSAGTLPEASGASKTSTNGAETVSQPAAMKGFKPIAEKPKKKKKKKEIPVNNSVAALSHPEELAGKPSKDSVVVDTNATNTALAQEGDSDDDDMDIFAGAGHYVDEFAEDDEERDEATKQGQEREGADIGQGHGDKAASGPPIRAKYFDDEESIIPRFQTYRSPTPPPRRASPFGEHDGVDSSKPQRLEGLSTSSMSAKQLLAYDDYQIKEEKRKLKKLKGKEKKEALEREAELDGKKSADQKEKDRLNKEVQEYEKYERKKAKHA